MLAQGGMGNILFLLVFGNGRNGALKQRQHTHTRSRTYPLSLLEARLCRRQNNGGIIIIIISSSTSEVRCWDGGNAWSNAHSIGALWRFQAPKFALQASTYLYFLSVFSICYCQEEGSASKDLSPPLPFFLCPYYEWWILEATNCFPYVQVEMFDLCAVAMLFRNAQFD